MLSDSDKNRIRELHAGQQPLTDKLREALLTSISEGEVTIFENDDDYLCCDLGIDQPDRYKWTTFENCRALGGRAASNDECPDRD